MCPNRPGSTKGRPHLPHEQVRRPGMTDDTAGVERTGPGASGDESVEAVAASIAEDPGVAPRIVADSLVPARIELDDGVRRVLGPCQQVGRRGQGETLIHTRVRPLRARVEEVPRAIVLEHRAGPRCHALPRVGRTGFEDGPQDLPGGEVGRDRVADRGVPMALDLIAERLAAPAGRRGGTPSRYQRSRSPTPNSLVVAASTQPLRPLVATPRTNWRWKMMKTMSNGMTIIAA